MDTKELKNSETINLVISQNTESETEAISLRDIFVTFGSGKRIIAAFTVIAFFISLIAVFAYAFILPKSSGTVKALVSFNFDGIENGLDPHGKIFDINKLKSPVVLDRVMDNLSLYERKLTTEDIRKNINIEGVVPADIIDKMLTINRMAEKDVTKLEQLDELEYHPTQFLITFNVDKSLNLSENEAKSLVNDILSEYRNYFFDTYSDKDVLASALGEINYEDYDYPEVSRVMNGQIDIMRSYLNDKLKASPDFRAKSTQMSFGDIISYINILEEVDISRMNSLVSSYNLTKDKNRLLSLYQYRIEQYQLDMAKDQDESKMTQEAIDKYQKDKSLVVVPGMTGDAGGVTEIGQNDEYYNQLMQRALDKGVAATDCSHEIDYFKTVIDRLNNDTVLEETKQMYMTEVDSMVVGISDKLKEWVDIANKTVDEYYETEVFNNAVKIPVQAEYVSALAGNLKKLLLIMVGITMAGLFAGIVFVFFRKLVSGGTEKVSA